MAETAVNASAELVVEHTAYGRSLDRRGNRSFDAAPQGLYRCQGEDAWLALSIETDEQWDAARAVLGNPGWAAAPELATAAGRQAGHDRLDVELAAWAATQDAVDATERLIGAGVPAGTLTDPRLAHEQPQMAGWGYFEAVDHPVAGRHPAPSLPFRFADVDRWFRTSAPLLGEHNEAILCGLLGVDPAELVELAERNVIGDAPLGSNPSFNL
jgi:crotonobetainyl-CoA:carnitine CoA-transferase CaiB-like acyl-CoA transferase